MLRLWLHPFLVVAATIMLRRIPMTSKRYHIIPPDENRCVWMTANVLPYKLCDREYECEECPLDWAIRRQVRPPAAGADASLTHLSAAREPALLEGCRYSRNHCWILNVAPRLLRVGIEPGFARVIGRPKAIVLPLRGQNVHPGQTCAWVVVTGETLSLKAPVGGSVRTANALLTESPHLLHQSPFDKGWLYEVAVDEDGLEEADLVSPDRIADTYAADEMRFLAALTGMLRSDQPDVGLTLADVEQRLESILDLVGPTEYFSVVRRIYA
jgi:glycine cleavage system H protein